MSSFIHFSLPHKLHRKAKQLCQVFPIVLQIHLYRHWWQYLSPSILSLSLTYTSSIWPCAIFRIFCNYGIITTEISTSSNNKNKNNISNESTIKSRTAAATSLSHCWNLCCLHLWKQNLEQKKNCTTFEENLSNILYIHTYIHWWYVCCSKKHARDSGNIYNYYSYANTEILREHESKMYVGIIFI